MLILFEEQEKLKMVLYELFIYELLFQKNRLYLFPFLTLQVHKQSAENKVKVDKTTTSEKPRQLYWEKRLSGIFFDLWKKKYSKNDNDFMNFRSASLLPQRIF